MSFIMTKFTRRDFVKITAAGTGGLLISVGCTSKKLQWRFFTDEEAGLVEAIAEGLIPADDFAGAKEANVVNFIDKQLTGYYKRHQNTYRTGLRKIGESCTSLYNKSFIELAQKQQVFFLKSMEYETIEGEIWKDFSARDFFNLMLEHTLQGFYGSPRHGGNKNHASYRMLDLDYPLIIGRNKYSKD
jgi:gluconate 2-dehydrogenase gamma chain